MPDARYGYYRYGKHEYEPPDRDLLGAEEPEDYLTPREAFGAGVAIKPADPGGEEIAWDFAVDQSGDLAATEGFDELGKDLAFGSAREAGDLLGMLGTANDLAELEITLERVARRDSRVFGGRATVQRATRGPEQRGVGDELDPGEPGTVDVDLDVEIRPNITRQLGFWLRRR